METIKQKSTQTPDWLVVRRPGSPVLFFIVIIMILGIGWMSDYKSCKRQQSPRAAVTATRNYFLAQANRLEQRSTIDHGKARALDIRAAKASRFAAHQLEIPHLECFALFPPTG